MSLPTAPSTKQIRENVRERPDWGRCKNKKPLIVLLLCAAMAMTSTAQTFTALTVFNGLNGASSRSPLIQGVDGNLYGTTYAGGTSNYGTIFRVTPAGVLTTLYSFSGADGQYPYGGLALATDGNFYGTTHEGGTKGSGTIFKIPPSGTLTTLYSFGGGADGGYPAAGLVQGTDGNFYGTTSSGGLNLNGTVFKITPGGALTTLYRFSTSTSLAGTPLDGADPEAGLVQGTDGSFYGTTKIGGVNNVGTVFKITSIGALTTLYNFGSTPGDAVTPEANLIQAADGSFYGTTYGGGSDSRGTVFKITSGRALTILHSFADTDGNTPSAPLIQAADGNLYGTTSSTIFEITPSGALTTLHSLEFADGNNCQSGLLQAADGNLYGTTYAGGTGVSNDGTIFRLQLPTSPTALPSIKSGGVVSAGAFGAFTTLSPGTWIEVYGSNLAANARSWAGSDFNGVNAPTSLDGTSVIIGGEAAFIDYISAGQVNAQVPSDATPGQQSVIVKSPAGSSTPATVTITALEPGFLAPPSFSVSGKQYVVALFPDGVTYVLPPGAIPSVQSRRAQPGDVITLYGIGFGPVIPGVSAGQIVQQNNTLASAFQLSFGTAQASLNYDGLAPQAVGLYQFNVVVPTVTSNDLVPLTFTLGGAPGPQTLYIAVQNGNPAPQIQSLTLSTVSVAGGGTVQGTVSLSTSAPIGGVVVALSSNSAAVSVPATLTVPAGATSATFTVSTSVVSLNQSATITASYGGSAAHADMTVLAPDASGQCYQFSSGSALSVTVNISNLPTPPAYAFFNPGFSYDYLLFNIPGNSASITVGQAVYAPTLFDINVLSAVNLAGPSQTQVVFTLEQSSPSSPSAVIALTGPGNLLPNGLSTPLPPLSAWTTSSYIQAGHFPTTPPPANTPGLYPITAITSCSGSPQNP